MHVERAINIKLRRFEENPLITPSSDEQIGVNINGPSLIQAPDWLNNPLGEYYMYFAHHHGEYIRLAYADRPNGDWTVYSPGTLDLDDTPFDSHLASPDIHIDEKREQIIMYFHGCCGEFNHSGGVFNQVTDVATSNDGINFETQGKILGNSYFRVWKHGSKYYAIANDGHLYCGDDRFRPFKRKQELFSQNRHFAIRFIGNDLLQVFLTRRGDRPERIMVSVIDLSLPDEKWHADPHPPKTILWPSRDYEGGNQPLVVSERGSIDKPVRALRDPAILKTTDSAYLFYAIAGERGIAGAEIL